MNFICINNHDSYSNVDVMESLQGLRSRKLGKLQESYVKNYI